jgi:hypothetical protein
MLVLATLYSHWDADGYCLSVCLAERTMALRHIVDQLHDQHSLADTGAAKQADLAAALVRREEVDDLRHKQDRQSLVM